MEPDPVAGLIVGRIVHYALDRGRYRGECRPGIVVKVWTVDGRPQANGLCQLVVFLDGTNDYPDGSEDVGHQWATSVEYKTCAPGLRPAERSWHWPQECGRSET